MKIVISRLTESLNNGDVLLAMIVVAVAIMFNYRNIVTFFEDRKKARVAILTEALSCEHVTGLTKEHLKEELATEQFKLSTGINLEREFREALIKAHKGTEGELSFVHFKRALPHIKYTDQKLNVDISIAEKIVFLFNFLFGVIMTLGGAIFMGLPAWVSGISLLQAASVFFMGALALVAGLFMLLETFPVFSAMRVSRKLEGTGK